LIDLRSVNGTLLLNPEKTASSKKRKAESILSTEINLTTSNDEGEYQHYLFTSSTPFDLVVSLIANNEEHLFTELAETDASSSIILDAYTSAPFIKTDDNNTIT
jgi:hypothetical protein